MCNTGSDKANLFAEEIIDRGKLSAFSFASRKEPEFMCHRLVQCPTCDLVYANQPPSADELARAYHVAEYDSSEEASDAAMVYMRALQPTLQKLVRRERALEIGTGPGIFLEHLFPRGLFGTGWSRAIVRRHRGCTAASADLDSGDNFR